MQEVLSARAVESIKFMLSPGDCTATMGFPDGDMTSVGFFIKKLDGLEITKSTAMSAGDWDLMVLTLPSLNTPLLTFQKLSTVQDWNFGALFLNGVGSAAIQQFMAYHDWSDVTRRAEYGWKQGLSTGISTPDGYHLMEPWSKNSGMYTAAGVTTALTPNYYNYVAAHGSNVIDNIASWRCTGCSSTMFLNANAVQNKGIVYSRPLERRVDHTTRNFETRIAECALATSAPVAATLNTVGATGPVHVLHDLPVSVTELSTSPHYKSNAYDGVYSVCPYEGDSTYLDTIADRALLGVTRYLVTQRGVNDYGGVLHAPFNYYAPDGSGAFYTDVAPVFINIDPAFIPTVTIFEGLDPAASVSIKTNMGVEFAPTAGGPFANFAQPAPQAEPRFMEIAAALQYAIQPGYPASSNGAWDVIKDIASGAWDVFKVVAPALLPLIV